MNRNLLVSRVCLLLTALTISACSANIAIVPLEPTSSNPTVFPTSTATPRPLPATPSPTALPTLTRIGSPIPATQTPAPSGSSGSSTKTITRDDNGQTITVRVGERFLVNLGDNFNWEVSVADPSIVSRVMNIMVIRGAQGVYEAKATGETTLTATGSAVCLPQQVCPDFKVSFKLHIVVK